MDKRRDVFHAISDPTRRAILALLIGQALTPSAMAEHFDTSRQAVSKHIGILVECELLGQAQEGREIYYHLNPDKLEEVDQWLEQFKELMAKRFGQLDEVLEKLKSKKQ